MQRERKAIEREFNERIRASKNNSSMGMRNEMGMSGAGDLLQPFNGHDQ